MDNRTIQTLLMEGFNKGVNGEIDANPSEFIDEWYTPYHGLRRSAPEVVFALGAMLSSCRTFSEYLYGCSLAREIDQLIESNCLKRTVEAERFMNSIPNLEL